MPDLVKHAADAGSPSNQRYCWYPVDIGGCDNVILQCREFGDDADMSTDMSKATDLSSNMAKEIVPSASQILAMAASGRYETPRVNTHRLDGVAMDSPLTMSGNV